MVCIISLSSHNFYGLMSSVVRNIADTEFILIFSVEIIRIIIVSNDFHQLVTWYCVVLSSQNLNIIIKT